MLEQLAPVDRTTVAIVALILLVVLAGLDMPVSRGLTWWRRRVGQPLPSSEDLKREEDERRTWVEAVGGTVVAIGLVFTWQQLCETREASVTTLDSQRQAQANERFLEAATLLGSNYLDAQVGGIYVLEQLASDPDLANDFYWPAMHVLASYVRRTAPVEPHDSSDADAVAQGAVTISALGVLADRNPPPPEQTDRSLDLSFIDLSGVSLVNANLAGANLTRATLLVLQRQIDAIDS